MFGGSHHSNLPVNLCMCIMWLCVHVHIEARSNLSYGHSGSVHLVFSFFFFWGSVSHVARRSPDRPIWLAKGHWESPGTTHPASCHLSWLYLYGFWESNQVLHVSKAHTFLSEPFLQLCPKSLTRPTPTKYTKVEFKENLNTEARTRSELLRSC